jgi:beta-N-acetylhexosaminidase
MEGMLRKARNRPGRLASLAIALLALATGAFALGVTLGDGSVPAQPSVASRLTVSQLAGQRIVLGFSGPRVPAAVERMIRGGQAAGVVLFAENLPSRAAGRRLIRRLQSLRRPPGLRAPLLIMADQEGGLVKRIAGAPTASAREMGARGTAFSRAQGRRTAANLRDLGINVNLAPVLDLAWPGGTIAAEERGFGATPARVQATAIPFAAAMQAGGVAATGKHFPGFGAARVNTDFAVQRIGLSKRELRRRDEAPFRSFIADGGDLIMLSTAIYPAFSTRPAAFSRSIATDELRSRLGFEGVSITDALGSVAVRAYGGPGRAALAAVGAGVDLLLYAGPGEAAQAHRALLRGLRAGTLGRVGFEESAERVLRLRDRLASG